MNGPEHYLKAEQLLHIGAETQDTALALDLQQAAQVHATLALAAATAMASNVMPSNDFKAWDKAAGVQMGCLADDRSEENPDGL